MLKQFITINRLYILKFLIVGLLSALLYFLTFTVLWKWNGIHYKISVSISYFMSVLFHFTANRYFTFRNEKNRLFTLLFKYISMVFLNYCITLFIVQSIVELLTLSPYVGIILSIGTTVNISYLMSRYWVFGHQLK